MRNTSEQNDEATTNAQVWDAMDYEGRPNKFLRDKPMKLVFDCYGESDFTWRYIMHDSDVVLYSVTSRLLSNVDNKLHNYESRVIAFFYETNGVRPRAKKSELQRKMSRKAGIPPDYKIISLGFADFLFPFLPRRPEDEKRRIGGVYWENSAALALGFDLSGRWPDDESS